MVSSGFVDVAVLRFFRHRSLRHVATTRFTLSYLIRMMVFVKAAKGPSMPLKRTGFCDDSDTCSAFHHQCCSWTTLEFDLRCRSLADTPLILSMILRIPVSYRIIPFNAFQTSPNLSDTAGYSCGSIQTSTERWI